MGKGMDDRTEEEEMGKAGKEDQIFLILEPYDWEGSGAMNAWENVSSNHHKKLIFSWFQVTSSQLQPAIQKLPRACFYLKQENIHLL